MINIVIICELELFTLLYRLNLYILDVKLVKRIIFITYYRTWIILILLLVILLIFWCL